MVGEHARSHFEVSVLAGERRWKWDEEKKTVETRDWTSTVLQ